MSSWKPSRENAQRRTSAQNPEPKPPSTPTKPKFPRKTRQVQDVKNRRGIGSCHSLNLTEAIAPKARDQVNRHPGARIGEKPPDEAVDREAPPNTSTSGSHHSNQEETSQHCESKASKLRPGEPGKENHTIFNSMHR